jgi:hypothetical protein
MVVVVVVVPGQGLPQHKVAARRQGRMVVPAEMVFYLRLMDCCTGQDQEEAQR